MNVHLRSSFTSGFLNRLAANLLSAILHHTGDFQQCFHLWTSFTGLHIAFDIVDKLGIVLVCYCYGSVNSVAVVATIQGREIAANQLSIKEFEGTGWMCLV